MTDQSSCDEECPFREELKDAEKPEGGADPFAHFTWVFIGAVLFLLAVVIFVAWLGPD